MAKPNMKKPVGLELAIAPGLRPKALQKALDAALAEGLREMGLIWSRDIVPKHFTPGAKSRYGYAARSAKYEKAKKKANNGSVDLVYSGKLRDEIEGQTPVIKADKGGLRVKYKGLPRYLYMQAQKVSDEAVYSELAKAGGDIKEAARRLGIAAKTVGLRATKMEFILKRRRLVLETWEKLGKDIDKTAGALQMSKTQVGRDLAAGTEAQAYKASNVNKAREITEVTAGEIRQLQGVVLRRLKAVEKDMEKGPLVVVT